MGVLSKLYNFVASTTIQPNEVNVNFDDIIDFINDDVIHRDGSKTMTAHLAGPATDPSSADQYSRKAYVDAVGLARLAPRPGGTWQGHGGGVNPSAQQLLFVAETRVLVTNVNGAANVAFPVAFPAATLAVIVSNSDTDANAASVGTTLVTASGFDVTVEPNPGAGAGFRVDYIAIGY